MVRLAPITANPISALLAAMEINRISNPVCPYLEPRHHIQEWQSMGADNVLLQGIKKGVGAPLLHIPTTRYPKRVKPEDQEASMTTIGEYLDTGAIRTLTVQEEMRTKVWTPVFGRAKKDSDKIRLITDLQHLNQCHQVPKHKAESWTTIQDTVGKKGLSWGITLDLKGFFHHLQMNKTMQRWMRFQFNNQSYLIQAMPFGWALSPWWANKFTKPIKG